MNLHPGRLLVAALAFAFGWSATGALAMTFLTEESPPLNFRTAGGIGGTATSVVREAAKRAAIDPKIELIAWDEAFKRAQSEPDTCVYSTVRNPERSKLFQWVGPIARASYSALALESFQGSPVSVNDLKQYRIGVVNDARASYLRSREFPKLSTFDRNEDIPSKLVADPSAVGVDLWVSQAAGIELAERQGIRTKEVFRGILSQDYWLACSPSTAKETIDALRKAIISMRRDGTYLQLIRPK